MFGNISYPCKHYHSDISIIEINQSNVSDSENIKIRHSERMLSHTILCNILFSLNCTNVERKHIEMSNQN